MMTSVPARRQLHMLAVSTALVVSGALLSGCGPPQQTVAAAGTSVVMSTAPMEVLHLAPRITRSVPAPPASPGNGNATAAASLDTAIGGIALGVSRATVLHVLGQPAVRTVTHGLGTPEWQYADGLTVQLTDPHNPASPDTVWEILAGHPFAGATTTGFRLGDSEARCRTLYQGLTITAAQVRQLQIEAADGTLLGVLFDPNGKATMLIFSSRRIVCPNCGQATRSHAVDHHIPGRENSTP